MRYVLLELRSVHLSVLRRRYSTFNKIQVHTLGYTYWCGNTASITAFLLARHQYTIYKRFLWHYEIGTGTQYKKIKSNELTSLFAEI